MDATSGALYECAICISLPEAAVHQCSSGHLFCAECLAVHCASANRNASLCPVCRVALPTQPIRCLAAEQAIALLPAECTACRAKMTRGELASHLPRCPNSCVGCVAVEFGCPWKGKHLEKIPHEQGCVYAVCQRVSAHRETAWSIERAALHQRLERLEAAANATAVNVAVDAAAAAAEDIRRLQSQVANIEASLAAAAKSLYVTHA